MIDYLDGLAMRIEWAFNRKITWCYTNLHCDKLVDTETARVRYGWLTGWSSSLILTGWLLVGWCFSFDLSFIIIVCWSVRGFESRLCSPPPFPSLSLFLSVYLTVMTLMFVFVSKFNNNKTDHTINKSFDIVCLSCLSVRLSNQPPVCLSVRLFNPEMRMTSMTLRRMTTITTTWDFLVISINLTKPLTWGFALAHPHSWSSVLLVAF